MRQWLNMGVALVGALMFAAVVVIGLQNPPPADEPMPTPVPPTAIAPTTTPAPVTPRVTREFPMNRSGLVLAVQDDGLLRLLAADGTQTWPLRADERFINGAWSPDGRHIVVAMREGGALVTHPDRDDALFLLDDARRLDGAALTWNQSITVALAVTQQEITPTVTLWSYRNRELAPIAEGRAPAAAPNNGPIAWAAVDGRAIWIKRDDSPPEVLVTESQLDALARTQGDESAMGLVGQPDSPIMVWSPDGTKLAFAVAVVHQNEAIGWRVATVTVADSTMQVLGTVDDSRVYQLGWLPDGSQVVFTSDDGLAMNESPEAAPVPLLSQLPGARYFAFDPSGTYMIVSAADGLYRIPIAALDMAQYVPQQFGPRTPGYERLDICCRNFMSRAELR